MFKELVLLLKENGSTYLAYDTTFNCGDFYVSCLLFQHKGFSQQPVIPCIFMLHDSKSQDVHSTFFEILFSRLEKAGCKKINIVTDREKSIANAIKSKCPSWRHFYCWNHIVQDIKHWILTHNGRREDVTVYSNHVKKLLNSNSAENFEQTFNNLKVYWGQSFLNYFENHFKKVLSLITRGSGFWSKEIFITTEVASLPMHRKASTHSWNGL